MLQDRFPNFLQLKWLDYRFNLLHVHLPSNFFDVIS
jgi:hypothetical protein